MPLSNPKVVPIVYNAIPTVATVDHEDPVDILTIEQIILLAKRKYEEFMMLNP